MKGLEEIEFIISVFVFITSLSFATILIVNNIPLFHGTAASETLKSKSWQHSEMLLFDEGYPMDWETRPLSEIKRVGFSTGRRYFLDTDKLTRLNALCMSQGYNTTKGLLGLDPRNDIIVEASYMDDSPVIGLSKTICKPSVVTQLRPQFQTVRIGLIDSPDRQMARIKVVII